MNDAVLNKPAEFHVKSLPEPEEKKKKKKMVLAFLTSPTGKKKGAQVMPVSPDEFIVKYTPREPGPHKLEVSIGGLEVEGSPFLIKVTAPEGEELVSGLADAGATGLST